MEDSLSPEYWSPPALTLLSESLATSLTLWFSAPTYPGSLPPSVSGFCLRPPLGPCSPLSLGLHHPLQLPLTCLLSAHMTQASQPSPDLLC